MSLPTKQTSGKMAVSALRWLIYGPPGIGKTALGSGFPNAMFFATEKGYKALKVFKKDVLSWEDFKDSIDDIVEGDHEFKTVIIDTVDLLFDYCSQYVCDKLGIEHESEGEWGRGWSEVKKEFTRVVNKLMQTKYGVIFISHTRGDKITTQLEEITKTVPTLSNQARKILLPLVDTIGCMKYRSHKVGKGKYEEQLVISFKPTQYVEAKDRTGLLPDQLKLHVIPDGKKTSDIVAKYAKKNYALIAEYYD